MYDLGVINGRVFRNGRFSKLNVYTENGKIAYVGEEIQACEKTIDCENNMLLPGFIDPHVHFSLKVGEFVSADDFVTGSKTAAYGGITTFIDFLEPIVHEDELEKVLMARKEEAKDACVDYAFHATLGNFKGNTGKLVSLCRKHGISSIKVFTTYSESNRQCSYDVIEELMLKDITVVAHAEEDSLVDATWKDINNFEKSRSIQAESTAVLKLCEIAERTRGKLYIVHVTAGTTVMLVARKYAKLLGEKIFLESCPHYFYLSSNIFNSKEGGLFLLNPPLREGKEINKMRKSIKSIHSIGTDHCPYMIAEKMKYDTADRVPKGIGGIENSFILMYNLFGNEIIPKFTSVPAKIFGLETKGAIEVGNDADLVIFNELVSNNIKETHSRCDYNVYAGLKVKGKLLATIVGGDLIVNRDEFFDRKGRFIERG